MATNSSENTPFESDGYSEQDVEKSFEESTENFEIPDESDTDDEHKILNEAFEENDIEFEKDQLKEYQANEQEMIDQNGHNKRSLLFLKRKWTIPEILTTFL